MSKTNALVGLIPGLLFCIALYHPALPQSRTLRAIDSKTLVPIEGVHFFNSDEAFFYVTNDKGNAIVSSPSSKSIRLSSSHVSYQDTTFLLSKSDSIIVLLTPKAYFLEEVVIDKLLTPMDIVETSISKVIENYSSTTNYLYGSYFEKLVSSYGDEYTLTAEIIAKKKPYSKKHSDRKFKIREDTYILGVTKNSHDSLDLNKLVRTAGGFNIVHFMDVVKTDIEFLNSKSIDYYDYQFVDSMRYSSDNYYIFFSPKSVNWGMYEGFLIIGKEDFSIAYCSYKLSPLGIKWADSTFIHGTYANTVLRYKLIHGAVEYEYSEKDERWYLKNCYYERVKINDNYPGYLTTVSYFRGIDKRYSLEPGYQRLKKRQILMEYEIK